MESSKHTALSATRFNSQSSPAHSDISSLSVATSQSSSAINSSSVTDVNSSTNVHWNEHVVTNIFLYLSTGKYPDGMSPVQRSNFKKRTKSFVILDDILHYNDKHQLRKVVVKQEEIKRIFMVANITTLLLLIKCTNIISMYNIKGVPL